MLEARESVSKFKIPQAESLPDPMFMFGYLNDGVRDLYTFDEEMAADSQWMFSVSQMFPYPGKLSLKAGWLHAMPKDQDHLTQRV
jgi:hypothetical protein